MIAQLRFQDSKFINILGVGESNSTTISLLVFLEIVRELSFSDKNYGWELSLIETSDRISASGEFNL